MTARRFLRAIEKYEEDGDSRMLSRICDAAANPPPEVCDWLESIGVPVDQFRDAATWGHDHVPGPFRTDWDDYNGAICEALRNHIDGTKPLPQEVVEWVEGL